MPLRFSRTEKRTKKPKEYGLVVVFGASDDLCELRGAINDEIDCCEGRDFYVNKKGLSCMPGNCNCHYYEDCSLLEAEMKKCSVIKAVWCDGDIRAAWSYETEIPHETFMIYQDGEKYCQGIVFHMDDIKE